jgi:soluble lytic murein transglycosylase
MLVKRQRYQKSPIKCDAAIVTPIRLGVWLALTLGLAGCAGAEKPVLLADGSTATPSTAATAQERAQVKDGNPFMGPNVVQVASLQGYVPPRHATTSSDTVQIVAPPPARRFVIEAREAMQKRQWATLDRLVPAAKADPLLGVYPEYWSLRRMLQDPTIPVNNEVIDRFLKQNAGTYLADRLKGDWLVAAARAGDYALAANLGPLPSMNSSQKCSWILAQHMTGKAVKAADVTDAFAATSACWTMLDQLAESGAIARKDIEQLLRASLETNKSGESQRLAAVMFDGAAMVQYAALMKNPRKWLEGRSTPRTNADVELATIALSRLAYGDKRDENARYIEQNWAKALPKDNMHWVWSQFGLVAALNVDLTAAEWYRRSGNTRLTDYNHAWQVRAELRQPRIDWQWVSKAIRRMSAQQAAEPVWVYWYARALDAQGNKAAATQHYQSIASDLSFYGQLASEELGLTPALPPSPVPLTRTEFAEARANPGLQRAIALFDLGWRPEAVPEWNFALRGMNDRQLIAAAELARAEHIYDRVVNTSLQTKHEIDFSQRFIAPFEGRVTEKAREINLDPAWVYGLIRQESRFITDARSRVGASGLMQLMPATARWVARKIGMKDFNPASVNDFDTNTVLGTNYLRMVLNDLNGSEVLATAGYNAGPGRPVQWRSKLAAPVEGAIFAETIPFTETRLYVKNVMSNAIYYSMMFTGKPQSLKERLGTIAPAPRKKVDLP